MGIKSLARKRANTVLGIDCSTHSIAYAKLENGKPVLCGEIMLDGADVFERLDDAGRKTKALVESGVFVADYVAIEAAIYTNNIQTAIKLAYVYGAVLRELMVVNPVVVEKAPISWQTAIGNPNLKKEEKAEIRRKHPGKSDSWYKNHGREFRKQRTLDIARKYFAIDDGSDNVGDAVGIALAVTKQDVK